ncbi:hypothetical protein EDC01DRAFT_784249 [Geopyxis carbonaria]|nr:hypothetical protein EDC01DRAFT_784249 [Geopyxis carbonaria]
MGYPTHTTVHRILQPESHGWEPSARPSVALDPPGTRGAASTAPSLPSSLPQPPSLPQTPTPPLPSALHTPTIGVPSSSKPTHPSSLLPPPWQLSREPRSDLLLLVTAGNYDYGVGRRREGWEKVEGEKVDGRTWTGRDGMGAGAPGGIRQADGRDQRCEMRDLTQGGSRAWALARVFLALCSASLGVIRAIAKTTVQ